ncbi:MAG: 23S rRNA (pseudouridine(1915)-N(3))-methyltransferase RlmH [Flavobacteriales bacterium]
MKICLLQVGKTQVNYIQTGIDEYKKRLSKFIDYEEITVSEAKKKTRSIKEQKQEEAQSILKQIKPSDLVILLDEKGKTYSSEEWAVVLQKKMNQSPKRIVFVIGGAYGFADELYVKFPQKFALSKMTFTHQMIRLFFVEQVYRAFSIMKNSPYHHS